MRRRSGASRRSSTRNRAALSESTNSSWVRNRTVKSDVSLVLSAWNTTRARQRHERQSHVENVEPGLDGPHRSRELEPSDRDSGGEPRRNTTARGYIFGAHLAATAEQLAPDLGLLSRRARRPPGSATCRRRAGGATFFARLGQPRRGATLPGSPQQVVGDVGQTGTGSIQRDLADNHHLTTIKRN